MSFALLIVFGIAALSLLLVLRRRNVRGIRSLVSFSVILITWAVVYAIYITTGKSQWLAPIYFSATVSATTLLIFILEYTTHVEWLTRGTIIILAIEPIITQVLFWTNDWHHYFFSTTGLARPWYWINAAYSDGLVLLALILLSQTFLHKSKLYLLQSITIALGLFAPILAKILILFGPTLIPDLELTPFPFAIADLFLIFCIYQFKLLDIMTISREEVVERMSDGWMVINPKNQIVDLNRATEALIGISRDKIFGYPAEHILKNWPLINQAPSAGELEIKGSVILNGNWRFLNVRVLPMQMSSDHQIGKLVLWRDITERKKADDARQKARDEMFVLLHSISGAASQTLNLNDFLTESLYQIGHLFQSQASIIFLLDKEETEEELPKIHLATQHGITSPELRHLLRR
jgi:PAS domain S-box-containing protein